MNGKLLVFALLAGVGLLSCRSNSTALLGTYRNPALEAQTLERLLVIGASDREQTRRTFERDLRDAINRSSRTVATASLEEMAVGEELTPEALRRAFAGRDIEAVLVTRVVDAKTTAEFEEGDRHQMVNPYANDFFAYYRRHIVKVPEPGGYSTGRQVQLETNLFDARDGKLIWQCLTQSYDDGDTLKVLDDIIKTLVNALKEEGLIG